MIIVLVPLSALLMSSCRFSKGLECENIDNVSSALMQRYMDMAICYRRNLDYQREKGKLAKALEIDSKNGDVQKADGLGLHLVLKNELAQGYFRQAMRYGSRFSRIQDRYARFLFSEKRFHEAVAHLSNSSEALEGISPGIDMYKQFKESL
jgi:Tfp pilus assembly protein PilF